MRIGLRVGLLGLWVLGVRLLPPVSRHLRKDEVEHHNHKVDILRWGLPPRTEF